MAVWIIFCILAFILIYVGLNRGFAKSLISFLVNLFNVVLAFVITRILVNSTVEKFAKEMVKTISGKYNSDLTDLAVVETFAKFGMSVLVGIGTFYVLYCILHIINSFVKPVLFYGKVSDKLKYDNKIATVLVSLLSVTLTVMVFVTPIGVITNSVVPAIMDKEKEYRIPFVSTTFFDKLTEMPDNEDDIKTSDEVKCAINVYVAAERMVNGKTMKDANVELFRKNFQRSYFLPTVIAEVGSTAAEQWKNGDEFLGEKVEIPEGREGELFIKFLSIVSDWNKKVVVNDVNTILDIYKVVKDYGTEEFEEDDGLLFALADEKFTEDLFVALYGNKDFASMIPAVFEYGLEMALDSANIEMKEDYVSDIDVSKMPKSEVKHEGRIVSNIVKTALEIGDNSVNGKFNEKDVEKMVDAVSQLKDSKVLGDIANEYIDQLNTNVIKK